MIAIRISWLNMVEPLLANHYISGRCIELSTNWGHHIGIIHGIMAPWMARTWDPWDASDLSIIFPNKEGERQGAFSSIVGTRSLSKKT